MKNSQRTDKETEGRGGHERLRRIICRGEMKLHSFLFWKWLSFWDQTRLRYDRVRKMRDETSKTRYLHIGAEKREKRLNRGK